MWIGIEDMLADAALTDDPAKRLAKTCAVFAAYLGSTKYRKRKAFNPMLGETYEYVSENFRYLTEKVQHIPK